jgi:hypothetical protein
MRCSYISGNRSPPPFCGANSPLARHHTARFQEMSIGEIPGNPQEIANF